MQSVENVGQGAISSAMYAAEVMVLGPVEVAVCVDRGSLVDIDGDKELIAGVVVMQEEEREQTK